jgi:hypothetical protein
MTLSLLPAIVDSAKLSSAQKLLLYLESFRPRTAAGPIFALFIAHRLTGHLDSLALERASTELLVEHDALHISTACTALWVQKEQDASPFFKQMCVHLEEKQTDKRRLESVHETDS